MPAPIAPGDILEISEYRTPEFHSVVRVSGAGTVTLPMVNEVSLEGLDEESAARAIGGSAGGEGNAAASAGIGSGDSAGWSGRKRAG
jgi:hypothetical protein